jgi:hypothetical protein
VENKTTKGIVEIKTTRGIARAIGRDIAIVENKTTQTKNLPLV